MKDRVNVVPKAGIIAVLVGVQSSAHFHIFLDNHDFLAALSQITGADHTVMSSADHDTVVFQNLRHDFNTLNLEPGTLNPDTFSVARSTFKLPAFPSTASSLLS